MKVYRYSSFESNPYGHGGEKRTYQITELLKDLGISSEPLALGLFDRGTRLKRFIALFVNFKFIRSLKIPITSLQHYRILSSTIFSSRKQLKQLMHSSLILYEHAYHLNWFIPVLLKRQGHTIIAIPHNLETLVIGQSSKLSKLPAPIGFLEELLVLKTADLVLSISKEEEWLLNLLGVNTIYFPYAPGSLELIMLDEVKIARKNRKNNSSFLIMGTAGNPPTIEGMTDLLTMLNIDSTLNFTFHIAGFSTDKIFTEDEFPERFKFYGSVSNTKLYELYKEVDAAIINQKPSSGSLTKIPELLSAGVPVIVNTYAARNFYNVKGVTVFRSFNEFINILTRIEHISKPGNFKVDTDLERLKDKIMELIK